MLYNSCFICYSTSNYSQLASQCLKTIKEMGIDEKDIYHRLDDVECKNIKTEFQSKFWYNCVINKIEHLVNTLENVKEKYKYFIMSDCDIQYNRQNKHHCIKLEQYINDNENNLFFMQEFNKNLVNTGFIIIKNNKIDHTINFFRKCFDILKKKDQIKKKYPYGDQSVINKLLKNYKFSFIPNKFVVWGNHIYNKRRALLHHSVCAKNIKEKLEQMEIIKKQLNRNL